MAITGQLLQLASPENPSLHPAIDGQNFHTKEATTTTRMPSASALITCGLTAPRRRQAAHPRECRRQLDHVNRCDGLSSHLALNLLHYSHWLKPDHRPAQAQHDHGVLWPSNPMTHRHRRNGPADRLDRHHRSSRHRHQPPRAWPEDGAPTRTYPGHPLRLHPPTSPAYLCAANQCNLVRFKSSRKKLERKTG